MIATLRSYLEQTPKSHLIFDFDGTIAKMIIDWTDWHKGVSEIYAKYDPKHGYHPHREHLFVNEFSKRFGKKIRQELNKFIAKYEIKHLEKFEPYEELISYIKNLPTPQMSVYSSNSRPLINKALAELELTTYFQKVVSGDDVVFIKPHPEGFDFILEPEAEKSEFLMIGDSDADSGAAQAVGIDFFKVDFFNLNR